MTQNAIVKTLFSDTKGDLTVTNYDGQLDWFIHICELNSTEPIKFEHKNSSHEKALLENKFVYSFLGYSTLCN